MEEKPQIAHVDGQVQLQAVTDVNFQEGLLVLEPEHPKEIPVDDALIATTKKSAA